MSGGDLSVGRVPRAAWWLAGMVVVAVALAWSPSAGASQGPWEQRATNLSAAGRNAGWPSIAVAGDGTRTAVWERFDGANWIVQARTRRPGGTFGKPVDLGVAGPTSDGSLPQIAVARDGTTTVVWNRVTVTPGSPAMEAGSVQASTRLPGGTFGAAVDVAVGGQMSNLPSIAVAPDGTTTVVLMNAAVQAVTRRPGGAFGAAVDLSARGAGVDYPSIAVAPDGTTTVVWAIAGPGFVLYDNEQYYVQASTRPPGGRFGGPVNLTPRDERAYYPALAVGGDGGTIVTWKVPTFSSAFGEDTYVVRARTRRPEGGFGRPIDLSANRWRGEIPQSVIARDGTATVAWVLDNGTNTVVQTRTRPPGGTFGAPVDLFARTPTQYAARRYFYTATPAVAPDGTTVVMTDRGVDARGEKSAVLASTRVPGGGFGAPVSLAEKGGSAIGGSVAFARDGTATAIWLRNNGANDIVQTKTTLKAPAPRSAPLLTGKAKVGLRLRCTPATFTGTRAAKTSWLRGITPIKGAHATTYKLTRAELGKPIACRIIATANGHTNTATSAGRLTRP